MPTFANTTPIGGRPESQLRLPAKKRISTPAAARLSTITEGNNALNPGASDVQPRGILRRPSSTAASTIRTTPSRRASREAAGRTSRDTTRSAPPAYDWVPEPNTGDEDLRAPVEGEKLAELRRNGGYMRKRRSRGGWGRLVLIIGLLFLALLALAVGLGVGLTRKHQTNSNGGDQASQPAGSTTSAAPVQQFPLGEYSMITALRTVATNCTSNPSTWRCYPYTTYDPSDGSTNTSSLASFNWIISNTSSTYATNLTTSTSSQNTPSNLTISSTNNPFSISFTNQSLLYTPATSTNATSGHYTFSFTQSKSVIPSTSLLSSGAAAECFFNSTIFTGTLYLDAASTFPGESLANETGIGGYTPWPYAIEISQSSGGGADVPACYEMVNGGVGNRITTATTPEAGSAECVCDYRNY
ncbi:hypothetical protein B0A54_03704 [Friedmanniomyces endolithicus]|uniref:Tat pathway signal sequence n=1 Tax=Friedmanniomyces endolithicus TaxID=329885 RepID=A0A4U0VCQ3_9PEZI|nr:hypothetical protein LTS09_015372 [Friedmanniomyces endolithicus]KAK0311870.1 hypothetical protein LTR01_002784 [Friedmanniomyces endolithicus]KAK0832103.1 hypothetical protein LTR73_002390 [Friedmanniomyces endolithicus]TKA46748.1 hypothetical protein B0A54_03704 [Friedmanniomyces endolithicus]